MMIAASHPNGTLTVLERIALKIADWSERSESAPDPNAMTSMRTP
jgi:hypothetical protein